MTGKVPEKNGYRWNEVRQMAFFCKIAGIICVMGASGYLSVSISRFLESRRRELRRLYSILLQLKSEIQYMGNTLPECFMSLSKGAGEPFEEWLFSLSDRMEAKENSCFTDIWTEELAHLYEKSALEADDLEPLRELADKLGNVDTTSQIKAIDYALLHIERNRTVLEDEMSQKKKVVATLSMFGGFMTLILLL